MGRRMSRSRAQRGFTLIELMVVIIVIGILCAVAIPRLYRYRDHARIATAKAFGHQVLNTFAAYSASSRNNAYPVVATCDELAQVVTANGLDFSPLEQARYCPAGTAIDATVNPFLPSMFCSCQDPFTFTIYLYDCDQQPPLACSGRPGFLLPFDVWYTLPLLEVQNELYLVASTHSGAAVVTAADRPIEGPLDLPLPPGP